MSKKIGWFSALFFSWVVVFGLTGNKGVQQTIPESNVPEYKLPIAPMPQIVNPNPIPQPKQPVEPDCVGVQVPIPKDCRVYNKSGSQCVWCSIECLARYHGVKELYEGDRRLTKTYTWATSPGEVNRVLKSKYPTVKWKQIQNGDTNFIKKYVCEMKLGVGFGVPGHMLNLVHYDEQAGIVKVIDNVGPKALQVQTWSMSKFRQLWDGWAVAVFPTNYIETSYDSFDVILMSPDRMYGLDVK